MAVRNRSGDGNRSGRSGSRHNGGSDTGTSQRCNSSGGSSGSGSGSSNKTVAAAPAMPAPSLKLNSIRMQRESTYVNIYIYWGKYQN